MACKHQDRTFVYTYIQKMMLYIDRLGNLGVEFPKEVAINMVLNSLYALYHQFIMNYNMNNLDKTVMEIHGMLKNVEESMLTILCSTTPTHVLTIGYGGTNKKKKLYLS